MHAFTHEPHLARRGLTNYWGYNTLGFFAPHARVRRRHATRRASLDEFKGMVRLLHARGHRGDPRRRLQPHRRAGPRRRDAVLARPGQPRLLPPRRARPRHRRHRLRQHPRPAPPGASAGWCSTRCATGCRSATSTASASTSPSALGRGRDDGYDPDHPFLVALRTDPVLSRVKLIAEPWDVGMHGWRTGQFPPPFAEWNDRYRDARADLLAARRARARPTASTGHGVRELATRLAGSQDLFGAPRPRARSPRSTSSPRTTASRSPT